MRLWHCSLHAKNKPYFHITDGCWERLEHISGCLAALGRAYLPSESEHRKVNSIKDTISSSLQVVLDISTFKFPGFEMCKVKVPVGIL